MNRLITLAIYAASVFVSDRFSRGFWIVGPVFALAYLLIYRKDLKNLLNIQSASFIAASTLTYALVYTLASKGWNFKNDLLDLLFGSMTAGVIVGSLLMPFIHSLLFSTDMKNVRKTALWLIASWYGVCLISLIDDFLQIPWNLDYLLISIALWQGIYIRRLKI